MIQTPSAVKAFLIVPQELPCETVTVKEWKLDVRIKALDGSRVSKLFAHTHKTPEHRPAWLCALGVCDDAGDYLFEIGEVDQALAAKISARVGYAMLKVAAKVSALSGLDEEDDDAKKG